MLDLEYTMSDSSRWSLPKASVKKVQVAFKGADGQLYRLLIHQEEDAGSPVSISIDLEYPPEGRAVRLESIFCKAAEKSR